jgi:hypothetical protein
MISAVAGGRVESAHDAEHNSERDYNKSDLAEQILAPHERLLPTPVA